MRLLKLNIKNQPNYCTYRAIRLVAHIWYEVLAAFFISCGSIFMSVKLTF